MSKTNFKIWCEWDMGEGWEDTVFTTKKKAQKSIDGADWGLVEMTLEEVQEENLVQIEEVNVK